MIEAEQSDSSIPTGTQRESQASPQARRGTARTRSRRTGNAEASRAPRPRAKQGRDNTLLPVPEVAVLLGVKKITLYQNWRKWGLRPTRIGGRDTGGLRFRRWVIDELIEKWSDG